MVTPAILTEHGVSGSTDVLRRLIEYANHEIDSRYGTLHGQITEEFINDHSVTALWLKRRAESIVSVHHGVSFQADHLTALTLNADDGFRLEQNGHRIARIGGVFHSHVKAVYEPYDDEILRDQVVIELAKLAAREGAAGAVTSKSLGDLSISYQSGNGNYVEQRERILRGLPGYRTYA